MNTIYKVGIPGPNMIIAKDENDIDLEYAVEADAQAKANELGDEYTAIPFTYSPEEAE